MAFFESPRFPDDISYGSRTIPKYNTTVKVLPSGFEKRNQNWAQARYEFDVAYGVKTLQQLYDMIEFFHVARGRANSFRFKDFFDFKSGDVTAAVSATDQSIGVGDGIETVYQMKKTYSNLGGSTEREIVKPVSGTILVAVNGVTQTETTDYTIDYTTGKITFVVAPPATEVVSWGGEFDVPCRFAADEIPAEMEAFELGTASVILVEDRISV